jgi:hypothetical protein
VKKRVFARLSMSAALGVTMGLTAMGSAGSATAATTGNHTTVPTRSAQVRSGHIDTPQLVGPNVNVSNHAGAQSETTIAVDPTNPKHQMAAWNDLTSTAQVYESTDRGVTWVNSGFSTGNPFCYDPWLDFNSVGDAFFAYECSDQRIAYKLHGSSTWVKTTLQNSSLFPDRDMVVTDDNASSPFFKSVYVGYDEANVSNAAHVWYSRNGQTGWVKSPKINDTGGTIGVNVAVGSTGTIYATWEDWAAKKIFVDKSTDGGATWGTDHVVTSFRINTTSFFISIPPQPQRGVLPMPFSDAAPQGTAHAGRLYVSYFDKAVATANTNIYIRYSDDGGVTWSAEKQVNDDTVNAYHFFQGIAVQKNGNVGLSFYDTRNDQPANKKTDRYFTFSTDGGVTWSANQKITTAMSDESGNGDPNDYGDYEGLDAARGFYQDGWTDSRVPGATAEDMFTASVK